MTRLLLSFTAAFVVVGLTACGSDSGGNSNGGSAIETDPIVPLPSEMMPGSNTVNPNEPEDNGSQTAAPLGGTTGAETPDESTPASDPVEGTSDSGEAPSTDDPVVDGPVEEAPDDMTPVPDPSDDTTPMPDVPDDTTPVSDDSDNNPDDTEAPVGVPAEPTGLITAVSVGGVSGQFFEGSSPEAVGSITIEPLSADNEPVEVISGGSLQILVKADVPFIRINVVSDDEGYFALPLPAETTEAELVLSYNTIQLDADTSEIKVQVESSAGDISPQQTIGITTLVVGTGDVQVSVSWDTESDVDLALIEPDGNVISFQSVLSPTGGMLDLDSNPICFIDGVNNENITYEGVTPPSGTYTVAVSYYLDCDVEGPTNYVVTVRANGQINTFGGTFTAADVRVEPTVVTTFTIP